MNVSPMNQEKILIVEDEENERTGLAELVSAWGYRAETARDGAEGLDKVTSWAPSIVVTDLKMPRMGGLELLERLATDSQTMAVIVVTAQGTIDSAVQAMRMGAYDYITKPIDTNRLRTILQNASALLGTKAENEAMRRKLRDAGSLGSLVGASKKMQEIFRLIEMVAPSTASVLITGASGPGKEKGTGRSRRSRRTSQRSLLSFERVQHSHAIVARTQGRHPRAGAVGFGRYESQARAQSCRCERSGFESISQLFMAGECSRIAEHPGTGGNRLRRACCGNQASAAEFRPDRDSYFG